MTDTPTPYPTTTNAESTSTIILSTSFKVPLGLAAIGMGLGVASLWVGVSVVLFALFLAVQAVLLRLHFTPTAMELYRQDTLIRQFPYSEWLNWRVFWPPVPILFYFREVKSIHFVPILFDPIALQACLTSRCPLD